MIVQGSPEWFAARLGKVTASRVCDVVAKTKTGSSASRASYMAQLISERLTGVPQDSYTNAAMQHGIDTEPQARAAYEFHALVDVTQVGFISHPSISGAGASPDGLIGDDGLLEIKCPATHTHIETLIGGQASLLKYGLQMQFQMACTGRQWVDFVSYDPRLPGNMRLFVHRVKRTPIVIDDLENQVRAFLAELDEKVATLTRLYGKPQLIAAE